jgi:glutaminyl-peptide cyclotransferase
VRPLVALLAVQLVIAGAFVTLAATGNLPFSGGGGHDKPAATRAQVDRFDGPAAFRLIALQLGYGPRPAGSAADRRVGLKLRSLMPHGRFQAVPGGLRNVVATVPGRDPGRYVVVGAHYDTDAVPAYLGANDGAAGTAAVVELARQLRPRTIGPTVQFVLFDGEETAAGVPDSQFLAKGLRGSKVAARVFRQAQAMILLDFIGQKNLSLPEEESSDPDLWQRLRAAAARAGVASYFPNSTEVGIYDDHTPFLSEGIPAIDLIDWDFPCYHKTCDNLSAVSEKSLDVSGEAVAALLPTL